MKFHIYLAHSFLTFYQGTDFVSAAEKALTLIKLWPDPLWPFFHSVSLCRGCLIMCLAFEIILIRTFYFL